MKTTFRSGRSARVFDQFGTGHALAHLHVGEHEVDVGAVFVPHLQGLEAAGGFQDAVAIFFENAAHQFADGDFILDDEDGFGHGGCCGGLLALGRHDRAVAGEEDKKVVPLPTSLVTSIQPWCCLATP